MGGQRHATAAFASGKDTRPHCTGGWVGPRAGLDGRGKCRPHRDSILVSSACESKSQLSCTVISVLRASSLFWDNLWMFVSLYILLVKKVKWSRYRPGVVQRVGRGIALLFHDRGTRRGWVASSTPRPHFTPGKDPVPILQEAGWAPGPIWTGGKSRPHRYSIPDRTARSQSLYRLSYPAHSILLVRSIIIMKRNGSFRSRSLKYCG